MKNILVTNGAFTEETEEAVLPYIDAMNIDLKGFTEDYYEKLGGDLETVKAFIKKGGESMPRGDNYAGGAGRKQFCG